MWKARFSLRPVKASEIDGRTFSKWFRRCRWVENTPASEAWAQANLPDIKNKLALKLPQWEAKSSKPILAGDDGQTQIWTPPPRK